MLKNSKIFLENFYVIGISNPDQKQTDKDRRIKSRTIGLQQRNRQEQKN